MQDAKELRSRTRPPLENNKQNVFASENNLESTRIPWIHKGPQIYNKKGFWNPLEKQ